MISPDAVASAEGHDAVAPEQAGVQSIETGMQLLAALADLTFAGPPPMLKTLAAAADLAPAKAHRYMVSFLRTELVERDGSSGRYRLGPLARRIGIASIRSVDVVRTASARLADISADLQHSVALAVWGARGPTVVWVQDFVRPITINTRVGEILPLLTSATGRVFGAYLTGDAAREVLNAELAVASAGCTDPVKVFAEVRKHGVGWTTGGLNATVNALSAPIFDFSGGIVAALSTLGPADLFDAAPNGALARRLKAAAGGISLELGYRPQAAP